LLGYLAFATESAELKKALGAGTLPPVPGGAFYIPLSPKIKSSGVETADEEREADYLQSLTHLGRADRQWLESNFDTSASKTGNSWNHSLQFKPSERSTDFVPAPEFSELLDNTRHFLSRHANAILAGKAGVLPARFGAQSVSCDFCPFQPICRFEPVFGNFRPVKFDKPSAAPDESAAPAAAQKTRKPRKTARKSP